MIAPVGDNGDRFQAFGPGLGAQQAAGPCKCFEGQTDFRPVPGHVEAGLVVLPGQYGSRRPKMDEVALVISPNHQPDPGCALRHVLGEVHPHLDETAVVLGADPAGHARMRLAVLAQKRDLAGRDAAHHAISEEPPPGFGLHLEVFDHVVLGQSRRRRDQRHEYDQCSRDDAAHGSGPITPPDHAVRPLRCWVP